MEVITAKNVKVPMPSAEYMRQLRRSLLAFAGPHDPLTIALSTSDWPGRQTTHSIYSVGLTTIIDPKGLDRVDKPFCRRFLAGGHKNMTTAAGCWATHEAYRSPARVMTTFRGPEAADVLTSAEELNNLSELTAHPETQYEPRVLRIPGLYLEAFWLKSAAAGDLIVPYGLFMDSNDAVHAGREQPLKKGKAYPAADFQQIVGKAAEQQLAADLALRGQPVKTRATGQFA
jgi:hypothetical protein